MSDEQRPIPLAEEPSLADQLRDHIKGNEHLKGLPNFQTPAQIAEQFNTTVQYVYQVRHELSNKRELWGHGNAKKRVGSPISYRFDPEEMIKLVENEAILSPLDRLKILSRLIRTGAPAVKIQAIKTLEDLGRTTEQRVGPPPPLTEEDRIARLGRLLLAVGEPTASKAWEVSFGYSIPRPLSPQETIQPGETELHSDVGEPELPLRDLSEDASEEPLPHSGSRPSYGEGSGPLM